ncbi:MAG TPA: DUF4399 domain-containing protein [Gammaproteobacteria bacterium]|jgi:hypothetical protein
MNKWIIAGVLALTSLPALAEQQLLQSQPAPAGARAYIISPVDGEKVTGPVHVRFGLAGMGVAPAGVEYPEAGHHHLLVNAEQLPPANLPIPADERHRHFGKGQTETLLELPPGEYTLQLLLGDHLHIPHNPPVASEKIRITVVKEE